MLRSRAVAETAGQSADEEARGYKKACERVSECETDKESGIGELQRIQRSAQAPRCRSTLRARDVTRASAEEDDSDRVAAVTVAPQCSDHVCERQSHGMQLCPRVARHRHGEC